MNGDLVRLMFASGVSILVGGIIGAYAMHAVYGDHEREVRTGVARELKTCPPCECPACPPPPDCGDHGVVPTSTAPRALLAPDGEEPEHDKKAGLPVSAIRLASDRVREEVAACLEESRRIGVQGSVLLELTITTTATTGFVSDASLGGRSSGALSNEAIDRCLIEGARRTRFDWSEGEGEAHFRLPLKLGR
jgi:hypothetical protein